MNGATWSGSYALLPTVPPQWRIAAASDFDGDLWPDLVWQNTTTGERSIWLMSGSVWTGRYALLPTVPTQWNIAGVLQSGLTLIANAGADQDKNRGESTTLDGSASRAPSGAIYTWRQVSGPDVTGGTGTLTGVTPSFVAPSTVSTLEFDLKVTSGNSASASDRVVVSVLEDKAHAFFVGPNGSDANAGTRSAPFLTIQKGIAASLAQGLAGDVYVQESFSAYSGTITLASGVSLYGGYTQTWLRHTAGSQLSSAQVGMSGISVSDLTIDGFLINVPDAVAEGQSNYGVLLNTPGTGVIISNDIITVGRGGDGHNQPAVSFSYGPQGFDGKNGGPGQADGTTAGSGGGAGSGSADGGGYGGGGGNGGVTTSAGQSGFAGLGTTNASGGGGGASGNPGGRGGDGAPGLGGLKGFPGGGGGPFGGVVGGVYLPYSGFNGGTGINVGAGGGGGGGGGGQNCFFCIDGSGNGGGGGGGGGGLGRGGVGGGGGGGSFGIFVITASQAVTISGVRITTAAGGNGGTGEVGGHGGPGGRGGLGGTTATNEVGGGGNGGKGGDGGDGGDGGGGGGGPSVCIVDAGGVASSMTFNTLTVGLGGTGGTSPGGAPSAGQPGQQVGYARK